MSSQPTQVNAEEADNLEAIEQQFAVKAVQHMSTYWSLLENIPGSKLRLTRMDDEIYEHLKRDFPEFDTKETINEDEMKSKTGKERWRKFMMAYDKKIDDFNFGTLLRIDPKLEYGEKETIFGAFWKIIGKIPNEKLTPRYQFRECSFMLLRLQGLPPLAIGSGRSLTGTKKSRRLE
ncbi:MAG: hypothetical protein M1816_000566 [Peltula sp. TS41687]|nr:MAG: hypothetical protein M1816_000566 [Peltula sp. TS41687]